MKIIKVKDWLQIYKDIISPLEKVRAIIEQDITEEQKTFCIKQLEAVAVSFNSLHKLSDAKLSEKLTSSRRELVAYHSLFTRTSFESPIELPKYISTSKSNLTKTFGLMSYFNHIVNRGTIELGLYYSLL